MGYKYRDAVDGEYVTRKYAEQNPKTTVRERDKPTKPQGNGGKGKGKKA